MLSAMIAGTDAFTFAEPGIKATCPDCGQPVITKCGMIVAHHFAHYPGSVGSDCDSKYHDGMSAWHMNWQKTLKNPIAGKNIEVVVVIGEQYKRADLIAPSGLIIEFQKSPISLAERLCREEHYKDMIWVVHRDLIDSKVWGEGVSEIPVVFDHPDFMQVIEINGKISQERFIRSVINAGAYDHWVLPRLVQRSTHKILWFYELPEYLHGVCQSKYGSKTHYLSYDADAIFSFLDYNWVEREAEIVEAERQCRLEEEKIRAAESLWYKIKQDEYEQEQFKMNAIKRLAQVEDEKRSDLTNERLEIIREVQERNKLLWAKYQPPNIMKWRKKHPDQTVFKN